MMKIDLDDLERKARKSKATRSCDPATADQVLALIARIRELETLLTTESDALDNYVGENVDEREDLEAMQKRMRRVLERGAVLP